MSENIHANRILILDFGSQTTQLIARRIREIGVYCEIHPYDMAEEHIKQFQPKGIVLSGGPETVTLPNTPRAPAVVLELGCPVLGICYGLQTMAFQLGGAVEGSHQKEFGFARIRLHKTTSRLFKGLLDGNFPDGDPYLDVWMSHGDRVNRLPEGFTILGSTESAPFAAVADEGRRYYGVQFHPEVTHTPQGKSILERFVLEICGCKVLWMPSNIIQDLLLRITQLVGKDEVILGLSGGVDSSVTAALLHQAIGRQLICVFIDNGLLRFQEAEFIQNTFQKHFGIKLVCVDAKNQFLSALEGIADPEQKRKVIGEQFVRLFEAEAQKQQRATWLAQGTIYPDVIESAASSTGKAQVIKTHHNVGGLPEKIHLRLLEPLRELFKDEVRKIGITLGLPDEMVYRHPFPGPGLAVRVLGEVKPSYLDILRHADAIFIQELREYHWYEKVSQAFAVFLPVKAVGIMGDARCYEYVIALRAVETTDFMTAKWAVLPEKLLEQISNRIMNEVNGVTRVVYDISSKPPATIEWE